MALVLENKQGLLAGDGSLPVKMAQYAKENGFDVVCISLSNDNYKQLKKYCSWRRKVMVASAFNQRIRQAILHGISIGKFPLRRRISP